jgi:hypothetical protein
MTEKPKYETEFIQIKENYIGQHETSIVFTKIKEIQGQLKLSVGFRMKGEDKCFVELFDLEKNANVKWNTLNKIFYFLQKFDLTGNDISKLPELIARGFFKKDVIIEYKENAKNAKYPYFELLKVLKDKENIEIAREIIETKPLLILDDEIQPSDIDIPWK